MSGGVVKYRLQSQRAITNFIPEVSLSIYNVSVSKPADRIQIGVDKTNIQTECPLKLNIQLLYASLELTEQE